MAEVSLARSILERYGEQYPDMDFSSPRNVDHFLLWLWIEGYQVVPVMGDETAN